MKNGEIFILRADNAKALEDQVQGLLNSYRTGVSIAIQYQVAQVMPEALDYSALVIVRQEPS